MAILSVSDKYPLSNVHVFSVTGQRETIFFVEVDRHFGNVVQLPVDVQMIANGPPVF